MFLRSDERDEKDTNEAKDAVDVKETGNAVRARTQNKQKLS